MNKIKAGWMLICCLLAGSGAAVMAQEAGGNSSRLPFQLVQQHGSLCLEVESRDFEFNSCIYNDPDDNGRCYPRNRAVMKTCGEDVAEQYWYYNPATLQLNYSYFPKALCLTRMVRSVEMQPCLPKPDIAQQWQFSEGGILKSLADNQNSGSFLYALENQDLTFSHLKYQFTEPEIEDDGCFEHPVTGQVVCGPGSQENTGDDENSDSGSDSEQDSNNESGSSSGEGDQEEKAKDDQAGNDEDGSSGEGQKDSTAGDEGSSDDHKKEIPPPLPPKPKFWLSKRQTPNLSLPLGNTGRCLAVFVPQGCSPVAGDDKSQVCLEGAKVDLAFCVQDSTQQWRHDLVSKKVYSILGGDYLCLTLKDTGLSLEECYVNATDSQRWYFARGIKRVSYGETGLFRSMLGGLKEPYLYIRRLTLPYGVNAGSGRLTYSIVPEKIEGCFFHPVTGAALNKQACSK